MYRLIYTSQAVKYLDSLEISTAFRIRDKIKSILMEPWRYTEPLVDMDGMRKLRVGDYRVVLSIDREQVIVTIVNIGHRKNIYK
ncbi:type II toxin-antitoxin system RelE family toxin [Methanorbis furvi]|uniref:Type II toxin-antitoxin system RelE/ParE family toxin n=1 Tax=Methanorbis furvi TaxID=3028299 RepID=A0AAE4MAK6_9EURY|nr:hypothetical protein [Methanocorpusculaceae archaeon Ag1]